VSYVTTSFNAIIGKLTEISQRKIKHILGNDLHVYKTISKSSGTFLKTLKEGRAARIHNN